MSDLISRQAAIDYVDDVPYIKGHPNIGLLWKTWLEKLPSALPTYTEEQSDSVYKLWKRAYEAGQRNALPERKTGRWIPQDHNYTHGNISTCMYFSPVCSECGHIGDFNMNFCPNCGCKMEVEQRQGGRRMRR